MKNPLLKILVVAFVTASFVLAVIVAEQPAQAAESQETAAAADLMRFARGAQTWANNCARCHNMRDPKELRDDQWRGVIAHMRVRGNLTGQEARDVLAFLQGSN